MRRSGGSFGMVLLVVVTAIVLLLVSRAWRELARPAIDVMPAAAAVSSPSPSTPPAGDPNRPDLDRTRAATDAHASAVGEALEAID